MDGRLIALRACGDNSRRQLEQMASTTLFAAADADESSRVSNVSALESINADFTFTEATSLVGSLDLLREDVHLHSKRPVNAGKSPEQCPHPDFGGGRSGPRKHH